MESKHLLSRSLINFLPAEYEEIDLLSIFKEKISNWETYECPCQLYKTYIQHVGFIKMCIYLPIAPCIHKVHKNRFSLFLYFNF